jgi:hypothetical protein
MHKALALIPNTGEKYIEYKKWISHYFVNNDQQQDLSSYVYEIKADF